MQAIKETTQDRLADHVQQIADNITNGIEITQDYINDYPEYGYEILHDALDIRYLVDSENKLLKVEILVAFGGPNIWVDIWSDGTGEVRGYWWGDTARASIYTDPMGIFELLQEIRECR